jgi:hypothetical protein
VTSGNAEGLLLVEAPGVGAADLNRLAALAKPNGLVIGVARAAMLLGVVAFGIAASQVASEYSLGTLRQLLVRQPRRAVLLACSGWRSASSSGQRCSRSSSDSPG